MANGNKDIQIAPTCGNLKLGQRVRLVLTATPNVPTETVYECAKNLKYLEVYQKKQDEIKETLTEKSKNIKSTAKKDKEKIKREKTEKSKDSTKRKKTEKSKDGIFSKLK